MTIEVKDLGIGRLKREMARLKERQITLGLQGASGKRQHPGSDKTVAEIGALMEYGSDEYNVSFPARPFLRTAMDRSRKQLLDKVKRSVSGIIDGRRDADGLLDEVGEEGVVAVRKTMDDARQWAEPLAESTARAKGHDQPLVDSFVLRGSVSYAIRHRGQIVKQGGEE